MTPDQLQEFLEDNRKSTAEAIKVTVNGKIDRIEKEIASHNASHENDMQRVMPIILAFEASQRGLEDAKSAGKSVLWIAGFITAVGGAWLVLKSVFDW